jgi:hypothetical protein
MATAKKRADIDIGGVAGVKSKHGRMAWRINEKRGAISA